MVACIYTTILLHMFIAMLEGIFITATLESKRFHVLALTPWSTHLRIVSFCMRLSPQDSQGGAPHCEWFLFMPKQANVLCLIHHQH